MKIEDLINELKVYMLEGYTDIIPNDGSSKINIETSKYGENYLIIE